MVDATTSLKLSRNPCSFVSSLKGLFPFILGGREGEGKRRAKRESYFFFSPKIGLKHWNHRRDVLLTWTVSGSL